MNARRINLNFTPGIKSVAFATGGRSVMSSSLLAGEKAAITGKIVYNPIGYFSVPGDPDIPANREAAELCRLGIRSFAAGSLQECLDHFVRALSLNPAISGAYYALAVCFAKAGQWNEAETFVTNELNQANPHPRAAGLLEDLRRRKTPGVRRGYDGRITIFTIPKAFEGHNGIIQRNAIKSWLKLDPRPHIIPFRQRKGNRRSRPGVRSSAYCRL